MKKIIAVLSLVCVFCVTGCGKGDLSCTKTNNSNENLKSEQTVNVNFKDKKVSTVDIKEVVNLSEKYEKYADQLEKNLKTQYGNFKENENGIEIKSTRDGKKITLNVKADLTKMSSDAKNSFKAVGTAQTKDEVKKELESQGFTCK